MNTSNIVISQQPPAPATEIERSAVFGSPLLVVGENDNLYRQFAARVLRAVKPQDFIEELLVQDVIELSWDVRRMRRYKAALLSSWSWRGVQELAVLERGEAEARTLARDWAVSYQEDLEAVNEMLENMALPYEALAALAWADRIDVMEQIERIIANAERRRNDALREIERRRSALAAAVRHATADVVDAEFEDLPRRTAAAKAAE
jgi:hypothetical protein